MARHSKIYSKIARDRLNWLEEVREFVYVVSGSLATNQFKRNDVAECFENLSNLNLKL